MLYTHISPKKMLYTHIKVWLYKISVGASWFYRCYARALPLQPLQTPRDLVWAIEPIPTGCILPLTWKDQCSTWQCIICSYAWGVVAFCLESIYSPWNPVCLLLSHL